MEALYHVSGILFYHLLQVHTYTGESDPFLAIGTPLCTRRTYSLLAIVVVWYVCWLTVREGPVFHLNNSSLRFAIASSEAAIQHH